jgi:hypothetical protein
MPASVRPSRLFFYGTGTPRSWVEVREQELVIASFAA